MRTQSKACTLAPNRGMDGCAPRTVADLNGSLPMKPPFVQNALPRPAAILLILLCCTGWVAACSEADTRETESFGSSGALLSRAAERRLDDASWQRHGTFESWHAPDQVHERGEYRAGLRSGLWETWYPDASLASRGSFLLGKPEGVWIHRALAGEIDAELTGVYEDGEKIKDWYEEGVREGELRSGLRQASEYSGGLRNGQASTFYPSGAKEGEGRYRDGLMSGSWNFWNEDGSVDSKRSGQYEYHQRVSDLE